MACSDCCGKGFLHQVCTRLTAPAAPSCAQALRPGQPLLAAGWGRTATSRFSNALLYAQLDYVPRRTCRKAFAPFGQAQLFKPGVVCAGKAPCCSPAACACGA